MNEQKRHTIRNPRRGAAPPPAAQAVVEELEGRNLMSVTTWTASSISAISGYSLYSEARLGDNGAMYGVTGMGVGTSAGEFDSQPVVWDSNLANGLDSGDVCTWVTASVGSSDYMSMAIDGTGVDWYANTAQRIGKVTIRAAVSGSHMAMYWTNLSVKFYRAGQLVETVPVGNLYADTLYTSDPSPKEAVAVIRPSALNYDAMIVTGTMRFQAAVGTYPAPNAIFGQVFISDS